MTKILTFEEWFQKDLKRMRDRRMWHYPQRPVYETFLCCKHDTEKVCPVCDDERLKWRRGQKTTARLNHENPLFSYDKMKVVTL